VVISRKEKKRREKQKFGEIEIKGRNIEEEKM